MAKAPWTSDAVYDTAHLWAEECLGRGGSLLTPGKPVWTAAVVEECAERALSTADPTAARAPFEALFAGSSPTAIQLAAETYVVHLLPIDDMSATLKRTQVQGILDLLDAPLPLPATVAAALESGVASYGSGHAQRQRYLRFLLRFARRWLEPPDTQRGRLLTDPWEFRSLVHSLGDQPTLQREALLHIVFPDTFEYVISPADKSRIVRVFSRLPGVSAADNDDRALEVIRSSLEDTTGRPLNIYAPWFRAIWKEPETPGWTTTTQWAERLISWADMSSQEWEYKRVIADRMAKARQALLDGEPEWADRLKQAFASPNNLTHWQFENGPFLEWCAADAAAARAFLIRIWGTQEISARAVTDALALLPKEALSGPGARLAVAGLLMMGVEPYTRIPYRSEVARLFARATGGDGASVTDIEERTYTPAELEELTGVDAKRIRDYLRAEHSRPDAQQGDSWQVDPAVAQQVVDHFSAEDGRDPGDVYVAFVDAVDALRVRLLARGGPALNRLDAHGLAWWLVKGPPPDEWSPPDKEAFLLFQAAKPQEADDQEGYTVAEVPEKAWLVRGAWQEQKGLLERWLQDGFVSIGWAEVGEIEPGTSGTSIYARVKDAYPDEPAGAWRAWTGNLNTFVNRIDPGHLVVTAAGDDVYVGRVTGEATFDPSTPTGEARRRNVEWLNGEASASRAATVKIQYPSLYSRLRALLTVTDLGDDVAAVAALAGLIAPPARKEPGLRPADEALAAGLHLPAPWIQSEIIDLLAERRQVVFCGPPGTGKTFVAQRVANHLASAGGDFELVQFHPSYSYEDFFEGYRPAPAEGGTGVSFELTQGPLRRMAERAEADPEHPYVLIIDEINRGNVPKIFGELLFLLEYREERIPLQYSPAEPFGLPRNLYFIATMNTADRSIALVDAALRRRFYFVPFMPTEEPVKGVLRDWLGKHGLDEEPALLLDALNARIDDGEMAIGPSYFMGPGGTTPDLDRVWKHAIIPLLEEHYYGTNRDIAEDFGLDALRKTLQAPADAEEQAATTDAEVEPSTG